MTDSLFDRFRAGDRNALARLLSQLARGENVAGVASFLAERRARASPDASSTAKRIVALTGSPGVGKSSLIGKLIAHIRDQGAKVAVLACDPQSPYSGGALLGDRFRMPTRPDDDGVFIRSLAALSGHGAVADHLSLMVRLCQAFGFDIVLIETVGAGQGDTAVRDLADVVVLLVQPETGDDLQWEKAGILETADILVVHKCDLRGADEALAQVRAAVELSGRLIPFLRVSSKTGEGIDALWQAIVAAPPASGRSRDADDLLELAQQALATRFRTAVAGPDSALLEMLRKFRSGTLSATEAGDAVLDALASGPARGVGQ